MAKIGTVKFVTGLVKAVSIDGTERILHEGEKVLANEKVITGNFSSVVVAFNDGTWLDLGRDSQSALNDEVVTPGAISQQASNQAKQSAQNEVDVIQKALADESFDPTKSMEATAAGAAASGAVSSGGNNGHTFVSVDYLNPQVVPDSGFETLGNQAVVPEIPIEILILPPNPPEAPPISTSPEVINIAGLSGSTTVEGGDLVYTVTFNGSTSSSVSYTFNLGGGTASASDYGSTVLSNGVTYDSASGQITVPAGVAGFTVTLPTVQDTLIEPTESVPLTIGGITGTGGILDDDVNPTIKSIEPGAIGTGDDNVIEGNNLVYTVTLSELANTPISYVFNLGGGTASASDYGSPAFSNGVTYDLASGQITVPAGVAGFTVTLPTVQDTLIEPTESVPLTIGGVTGTGGILDDDINPPTIKSIEPGAIGTGDDNVIEGNNLVYTVTLSDPAITPISYLFNLGGGTASAGDYGSPVLSNGVTYDSAGGQITVPAGVAGFTVAVPTINDLNQEALETVPLTVAEETGSGGIIDNDSPTIKGMVINAVGTGDDNVSEGNNLNYHASLSNITTMATQYQFSLGGVGDVGEPSFSNGVVYDKASGQITVPTGIKGFTVTVPTIVDSIPENTESVPLTIGSTTAIGSVHDVIVQDPNSSSTEKTLSAETAMTGDNFALGVVAASQDPNPNANDTDINPIFSASEVDIVPGVDDMLLVDSDSSLLSNITTYPSHFVAGDLVTNSLSSEMEPTTHYPYDILSGRGDGDMLLGGTDIGNIPESIGSEVLTAGLDDRILTGGTGADNFVWNAGDTGVDIITDFNVGSGADVLDFSDLLEGEHSDSGSLSSFLTFSYDSNSQATTITIDADQTGQGNAQAQSIVLQNVDLTASGTLSSTDIINSLLANGNLQTDV